MMKVYGYVKDINDFSKGCVASGDTILCDVIGWTRFEAVESSVDDATGYMAVSLLFGRKLIPFSYNVDRRRALVVGQAHMLTNMVNVVPVRVVFGEGERRTADGLTSKHS